MSYSVFNTKQLIDVVKYRWVWIIITIFLLLPGVVAMVFSSVKNDNHAPLKVGLDYTGGTILQYSVDKDVSPADITQITVLMLHLLL